MHIFLIVHTGSNVTLHKFCTSIWISSWDSTPGPSELTLLALTH